jgi:predicted nucleotidyltransferase component of viral defense system
MNENHGREKLMTNGKSSKMLHRDGASFQNIIERIAHDTTFPPRLVEKDYYLSIILAQINKGLSEKLVFKGGTCLNKIYYSYYRLSEDLDFSLMLPKGNVTRTVRRKAIQPIKDTIAGFAKSLDVGLRGAEKAGRNESKQYIYYFTYPSVILERRETIKFEIGLRCNPILPVEKRIFQHRFNHPFTDEPFFNPEPVTCLTLKEAVAEKLRAACLRRDIAPRDFYDLDFLSRQGFNFKDKQFIEVFKQKLAEDKCTDYEKLRHNLGHTEEAIEFMISRMEEELFSVLDMDERQKFRIRDVIEEFDTLLKKILELDEE